MFRIHSISLSPTYTSMVIHNEKESHSTNVLFAQLYLTWNQTLRGNLRILADSDELMRRKERPWRPFLKTSLSRIRKRCASLVRVVAHGDSIGADRDNRIAPFLARKYSPVIESQLLNDRTVC